MLAQLDERANNQQSVINYENRNTYITPPYRLWRNIGGNKNLNRH